MVASTSEEIITDQRPDASLEARGRIRVLSVITALGTGGASKIVLQLASYFNSTADFDIQIVTGPIPKGRTDLTYLAVERGITTRTVPTLVNHISPVLNVRAVIDLRQLIIRERFDIVHTHSSVAGIVGRLAARLAGVPVIIHHVHGWALSKDMPAPMRALYVNMEKLCARYTTRIVAVSKADISKGLAHHIGNEKKFALIYNGIDVDDFRSPADEQQARKALGLDPQAMLVGMIGRLDDQKNPLDFIRAAAIVSQHNPNVQFLLVGDGYLRPECERLIEELNLNNKVLLLGFRHDVAKILSILTITALSSLWEGLPLVFFESMSAGKPIVANNVDGASEVVIDGETGFLVRPHQPAEMAERIQYLLGNEALCNAMGHTARQRSKFFSKQRMFEQIESLYRELLPISRSK